MIIRSLTVRKDIVSSSNLATNVPILFAVTFVSLISIFLSVNIAANSPAMKLTNFLRLTPLTDNASSKYSEISLSDATLSASSSVNLYSFINRSALASGSSGILSLISFICSSLTRSGKAKSGHGK